MAIGFEFDDDAVQAAENAALRSAEFSADPVDAAHAVLTALEPFVEKHAQFVRRSVLTEWVKTQMKSTGGRQMADRIEAFAEFLYRQRHGLGPDDPLPDKDDFVWKAFRAQAKDIIFFTDAQDAMSDPVARAEKAEAELRELREDISDFANRLYSTHPDLADGLYHILGY